MSTKNSLSILASFTACSPAVHTSSDMRQIQVQGKDIRGGGYRTFWHAAETQVHDRYSGDVIAKHPRLQILTQGLKFGDLTEQLDFLGTVR